MNQAEIAAWQARSGKRVCVGCGEYPLPYWTNCDADPQMPADLHIRVPPMPFEDNSLDEVYAGHFLEHLGYAEGQEFLRECHRCLAPGGRLGIVVPDTREVMRRWLAGTLDCVEWPSRIWRNVADLDEVCHLFLYSDIQESPHRWSYDADTLKRAMARAGFGAFREIDRYRDPRLGTGRWYQCGCDGFKRAEKLQ